MNHSHGQMITTTHKTSPNSPTQEPMPYKGTTSMVRYKECLKNHAASIGGNALDGCGEFIQTSGDEIDPLVSLICSACGCHRNFHRKAVEGCNNSTFNFATHHHPTHYENMGFPTVLAMQQLPYSESEDHGNGFASRAAERKKRVRTKFSQEQKEKMQRFAEKAGWKMVKLEDSMVQQFCQEIGIKRRVLKVWMHNNKHNYANKNSHVS